MTEHTQTPNSAAGSSDRTMHTTDPAVMRALAHPLRIDILEIMDEVGEATASEIAERLGQTVANCSFHLRILAAGGFIERAEPRGREKPWRVLHHSRDMRPDREDPLSIAESAELGSMYVQREAARMVSFLQNSLSYAHNSEWIPAVMINTSTFWATAEEMEELAEDLSALMDRFEGRRDPANRPEGARKGRMFATLNPELDDSPRDSRDDSAGEAGTAPR
ncbi:MAG TPA: helix-turn-helix domain-containing protein [Beutenbergiaceae bacterium]|nr:helix-turn-helix domain-containing protein [Beutenbergiaceae bacterium]